MTISNRWLIAGTGGIGGYFGGLLAHSGQDVTFLARGKHLVAMRDNGLQIETVDGSYKVAHPHAVDSVREEAPFDIVLFCVKTYDNSTAAEAIKDAVNANTVVISVQNGMDNQEVLRRLLPQAQVYPGLAHIVSARVAPGVIKQSGGARTVLFGDTVDPTNSRLHEIADYMRNAHIDATASLNIERDRWDKFVFIAAFSGMTALCRSPIGPILHSETAMDLYRRCIAETIKVAQDGGFNIGDETAAAALRRTEGYRGTQEKSTSSLLRDVLSGGPTEIESLNGAVVRRAQEHKVDVPINSIIYTGIKLAVPSNKSEGV